MDCCPCLRLASKTDWSQQAAVVFCTPSFSLGMTVQMRRLQTPA